MAVARWRHQAGVGADAAARTSPDAARSRAEPDNVEPGITAGCPPVTLTVEDDLIDDVDGLPVRVRLLDLPQPRAVVNGGVDSRDPPPLLTTYCATRLGADWRVRPGAGQAAVLVSPQWTSEWEAYWERSAPHLRVGCGGWIVWRDFAVVSGRSCMPHVLVECPAVDSEGTRWRVRVYVRPSIFATSTATSEAEVADLESALFARYASTSLAERYADPSHLDFHARRVAQRSH
jgi:hypothetical protein